MDVCDDDDDHRSSSRWDLGTAEEDEEAKENLEKKAEEEMDES